MQECGECSLCCKLINVPGIAVAGKWCLHCSPGRKEGGCTIHESRPIFCKGFHCFWRAESWPEKYRPDKCNVIFESLPGVSIILLSIDPSTPDAWKEKELLEVIKTLVKKGRPLVLKTINDSKIFIPEGYTQEKILEEIKQVIDWQRERNGSTNLHN